MPNCATQEVFALVAHGGVHRRGESNSTRTTFLRDALTRGRSALARGDASLDVVEQVVREMEDSGLFNAGRGSNANSDGVVETDAAIMDGRTLASGGVASMRRLKNPIRAARLLLNHGGPVLVVGDRGQDFARELGAETASQNYFINTNRNSEDRNGTVGAVALDRCGAIAAATSTGGFGAKVPGRVGDSPIVGAGVYADNEVGMSATGEGEFFVRLSVSKDIADRVRYGRENFGAAAANAMTRLRSMNADGGIIGVDRTGGVVAEFNTLSMVRGYVTQADGPVVASAQVAPGPDHRRP